MTIPPSLIVRNACKLVRIEVLCSAIRIACIAARMKAVSNG